MADIYVRSTDGLDADSGATWALAKATVAGAAAIDVAGDTVWVSQVHAESTASAQTFTWAGTFAAPVRVICGNDGAAPPTASATTASVTVTGAGGLTLNSSNNYLYVNGIKFFCGTGGGGGSIISVTPGTGRTMLENCLLQNNANSSGAVIQMGTTGNSWTDLVNTDFRIGNSSASIQVTGRLNWSGGALVSGGANPTTLFTPQVATSIIIENMDLTNWSTAGNLCATSNNAIFVIRNSKLPASWVGNLAAAAVGGDSIYEMFNCDSGDTNYRYWREVVEGSVKSETTIVRTDGASDGTTPLAWRVASNASASFPANALRTQEIALWNDTTGSAQTVAIEVVHDSVTALNDNEVWLEVHYLGTSGFPLGVRASDAPATVLTTAAAQTSSSVAWTTTGLTNPNKQKLSVTFTPQEKGFYMARVCLAKASYTVFVDPKLTVS